MTIRVVLADDQPLIRAALQMVITDTADLEVVGEAGNGAEAVRLTEELAPDVVVMDLRMPSMSGQTLYHSIASRWPHLATHVVVMTGDPEAEDHNEWLELHDLPVLMKPFELAQLEALLRAITAGERWRNQG